MAARVPVANGACAERAACLLSPATPSSAFLSEGAGGGDVSGVRHPAPVRCLPLPTGVRRGRSGGRHRGRVALGQEGTLPGKERVAGQRAH